MISDNENNEFINPDQNSSGNQMLSEKTPVDPAHVPFNGVLNEPGTVIPTTENGPVNEDFTLLVPELCPVCHSPLSWEGVNLICTQNKCIAKLITSISYFYSLKGMKVNGIGDKSIEQLLQLPEVYDILRDKPWALLDPVTYQINIQMIVILGTKTYENIQCNVDAINSKKTMAHFISGLGLPGLGYKTTLRLCQYLKSGKLNISVSKTAQASFLKAVPIYNLAMNEMQNFTFAPLPSPAKAIYCITGTLSKSREAMIEILSAYDYEFSSTVTREVNYLIVGEEPGKVKIKKASKHNIPQITEVQLFKIIQGG